MLIVYPKKWFITFPSRHWICHVVKFNVHRSHFREIRHVFNAIAIVAGILRILVGTITGSVYVAFRNKVHDFFLALEFSRTIYLHLAAIITRYFHDETSRSEMRAKKNDSNWNQMAGSTSVNVNRKTYRKEKKIKFRALGIAISDCV